MNVFSSKDTRGMSFYFDIEKNISH